jgi:putative flippase GtrA
LTYNDDWVIVSSSLQDAVVVDHERVVAGPSNNVVLLLIPAYQPGKELLDVLAGVADGPFTATIVVDDGSGPDYRSIFDLAQQMPKVRVIRHAVNLGKGAALKTGLNFCMVEYPDTTGVVTADADGQHDPVDICGVAKAFEGHQTSLVLGSRGFTGSVPLRSRFGNAVTRSVMRVAVGHRLTDTQTGLRAIPRALAERLLRVTASGYEFELEMLIAAKHLGIPVVEDPIRTIYQKGNPTSHFQPLWDSMRIYFVLLRFSLMSVATALIDNFAFFALYQAVGSVVPALVGARTLAVIFNYTVVRRAVFLSQEQHRRVFPRYLVLVAANLAISYSLISFFTHTMGWGMIPAKVGVEGVLFIANFTMQRDFVFARRSGELQADSAGSAK